MIVVFYRIPRLVIAYTYYLSIQKRDTVTWAAWSTPPSPQTISGSISLNNRSPMYTAISICLTDCLPLHSSVGNIEGVLRKF